MTPLFCFTLDTEPDNLWRRGTSNSFEHFAHLREFHEGLTQRGCRPTYLTTSEVVEHAPSRQVMEQILDTGTAEVGAHFHTWTRAWPFSVPDLGTPPLQAMAHQLGQDVEERMLAYTCESIETHLGVVPVSFRGGRWSMNGGTVTSMKNCGILVDSTIVPGRSWEDHTHPYLNGSDFLDAPRGHHFLDFNSMKPRESGAILELPVGCSFAPNRELALSSSLPVRIWRKACRAMGLTMGHLWLRPAIMTMRELRSCLIDLRDSQVDVWVAMIHSSEIGPNYYFQSVDEIQAFVQRCYDLVEDAVDLGARPATMYEVWEQLHAERANEVLSVERGGAVGGYDIGLPFG